MQKTSLNIILVMVLVAGIARPVISQVDRIDPPFWWSGMVNPKLQLMVYGDQIAGSTVELDYEGIRVESVSSLESPDYLFIDLDISAQAKSGTFSVELHKCEDILTSFTYELKEREPGSARLEGFNSSDVMYLIMPDRFANGDPSNDIVKGMREGILDRSDRVGRHGGDLQGIRDHLHYIGEMGFTAIWLNPILENDMERSSYHGYSTTDFYRVDPRYGTNEDFRDLTMLARDQGIKMIMDLIFNHIGSFHPWMENPPSTDWINFYPNYVRTNHRRTVNQDPYASQIDKSLMVDGWFVRSMPDLNQSNSFLANYLIQNSIWWIEYSGLAGIRMDTYPYPEKEMMAEWNRRVLAEYPGFNIVGEEWSPNPGLISYWQKGQINRDGYQGGIPSMMDFPLQIALRESLLAEDGWDSGWLKLYETLASDYLYPDPYNLVIFPDNHDMSRFYMQLEMDIDLYKLGIVYILTTRGIPQIFYGSEILMTHTESNHHGDIRKDFPGGWEGDKINGFTGKGLASDESEMQEFFKTLLNWRKSNPVIHTGKLIHYAPEDGVYVLGRMNKEKSVMVLLNKSDKKVTIQSERFSEILGKASMGRDVITEKEIPLTDTIEIPGKTAYILELN